MKAKRIRYIWIKADSFCSVLHIIYLERDILGSMTVTLDGNSLDIDSLYRIAVDHEDVEIDKSALERTRESRKSLEQLYESGINIYGVNTGFGNLLNTKISPENRIDLQLNLIRSHSSGVGLPLPNSCVRAMIVVRLNSLLKGFSGITIALLEFMRDVLNSQFCPYVPRYGSVGASGDLAPLAHIALSMMGEGKAYFMNEELESGVALRKAGLKPYSFKEKEGVSFINGTAAICGILAINLKRSYNLIKEAILAAGISFEALRGTTRAFTSWALAARNQPGQSLIGREMLNILNGSPNLKDPYNTKIQDAYSLRCIPQVYGAVLDTINYTRTVLEREINSVTDNPLIHDGEYVSAGNFHGEPVALVSDFMAIALTDLGNMIERRIARLTDSSLSGLPPFLSPSSGLNSGYMIPQYVAAALCNRNKTLCFPSTADSIPTSANQEDHVSMGTNAAIKLSEILDNVEDIVAIEMLLSSQGVHFLKDEVSKTVNEIVKEFRKIVPVMDKDRPPSPDIEKARDFLRKLDLSNIRLE